MNNFEAGASRNYARLEDSEYIADGCWSCNKVKAVKGKIPTIKAELSARYRSCPRFYETPLEPGTKTPHLEGR